MSKCRDSKVTYLRKYGYNVVSLPRAGIQPLTVAFVQDGHKLTELGYLPEIWTSRSSVPKPSNKDKDVANIGGQATDKLQANVGVDVFADLLRALGADPIGVTAEYSAAHAFQFHFRAVERERITPFALGKYLSNGELNSSDPFVRRYFVPGERLYIVTEVLTSTSFGVSAYDSSDKGLDVKVPVINHVLSGKLGLHAESASAGTVDFVGPTKLPFAFIAAQLAWRDDEAGKRWDVVDFPDPGTISLAKSAPVAGTDFIQPWKGGSTLFGDGAVDVEPHP